LQRICSETADWVLRANIGDQYEVKSDSDIPDFIVQKELRDRFEQIWTGQNGSSIIVEKVSREKRQELESLDPLEAQRY
jgi:hypothetical protein